MVFLTQFIREQLSAQLSERQKYLPVELLAHYVASSYLSILSWWLDHDLPYTAEQMDSLFLRLVTPGVREMLTSRD